MFKKESFIIIVLGLLAFIGYQEKANKDEKNKLLERYRICHRFYYNALNRMTRDELLVHLSCLQAYLESDTTTKTEEEMVSLKELEGTVESILKYM